MGEKYQYATTFSIPVLTEGWLSFAWSHRDEVESRADTKEAMNKFRLPIFAGNIVQFYGFEANELTHMQEVLIANGGKVASSPAERTHLVVDENTVEVLPASLEEGVGEGCHLVKGEWFWRSIQIEAAAKVAHHGWRKEQGLLSPNISGSFLDASDPRLLDGPADTAMVMVTPENSPSRGAVAASTPAFTFDANKATA